MLPSQVCFEHITSFLSSISIQFRNWAITWVAIIAPWFRLRLPSCGPRFKSQAHHLRFFHFYWYCNEKRTKINKKEARIGPFKKWTISSNYIFLYFSLFCTQTGYLAEAQLVEQTPLLPEVRGSNRVIGKNYIEHLFTFNYIEKMKTKKKRPGMVHFKKDLSGLKLFESLCLCELAKYTWAVVVWLSW